MNFDEIEDYLGSSLPEEYKSQISTPQKYNIEYKDWELFSDNELIKEINLSGNKLPYFKILEGHYKDSEGFDFKGRSKLKTAVAIGYENGDILFFDEKMHVYIFYLSSQEVVKIANSFKSLKKYLIKPQIIKEVTPPNLFGTWEPLSSTTHDMDVIIDIYPIYSFIEDGSGTMDWEGEEEKITWKAIEYQSDSRSCILVNNEREFYVSEIKEESFLYTNQDKDVTITYKRVTA